MSVQTKPCETESAIEKAMEKGRETPRGRDNRFADESASQVPSHRNKQYKPMIIISGGTSSLSSVSSLSSSLLQFWDWQGRPLSIPLPSSSTSFKMKTRDGRDCERVKEDKEGITTKLCTVGESVHQQVVSHYEGWDRDMSEKERLKQPSDSHRCVRRVSFSDEESYPTLNPLPTLPTSSAQITKLRERHVVDVPVMCCGLQHASCIGGIPDSRSNWVQTTTRMTESEQDVLRDCNSEQSNSPQSISATIIVTASLSNQLIVGCSNGDIMIWGYSQELFHCSSDQQ
jgi:hypothetical protein